MKNNCLLSAACCLAMFSLKPLPSTTTTTTTTTTTAADAAATPLPPFLDVIHVHFNPCRAADGQQQVALANLACGQLLVALVATIGRHQS